MRAIRAKHICTLAGEGPARGRELLAPLAVRDNAALLVEDAPGGGERLVAVCPAADIPAACAVQDLGDVTLIPGVVNCHTHVQLSALAGRTRFGAGFAAWLASLVPAMRALAAGDADDTRNTITAAVAAMHAAGTAAVGDIAGSISTGLAHTARTLRQHGMVGRHFCEWFGFGAPFLPDAADTSPWPLRVRHSLEAFADLEDVCAPSGHAPYSTSGAVLQRAQQWCARYGRVFCLHLAESPEETELLLSGSGPLFELYRDVVLPGGWRAPGLRPLAYVRQLGLLGPRTLAVHGAQLDTDEIAMLAACGTTLCLCPRSNYHLGVGPADIGALCNSQTLLCLGTDGLSSNIDLNVINEARFLREHFDIPPQALVRMLTVNGAAALGLPPQMRIGRLEPGGPAHVAVLPPELENGLLTGERA